MNRQKARTLVRETIVTIREVWDLTRDVEWEVLGGTLDHPPTAQDFKNLEEATRPEKIEEFLAAQKDSPTPLADILEGAAICTTKEQFNDDAWIDRVIDEIRENFRGVPIISENDETIIFEP